MFLHLGQDTVIIEDDIIGIFDLDTTTVSKPTRDYLKTMQKGGNVVNVSYDLPKSFVITCKKNSKKKDYVYFSYFNRNVVKTIGKCQLS